MRVFSVKKETRSWTRRPMKKSQKRKAKSDLQFALDGSAGVTVTSSWGLVLLLWRILLLRSAIARSLLVLLLWNSSIVVVISWLLLLRRRAGVVGLLSIAHVSVVIWHVAIIVVVVSLWVVDNDNVGKRIFDSSSAFWVVWKHDRHTDTNR